MQDRHEENWYDLYARAEEHAYQNVSDVQEVEKRPKDRVIEKVGQDVYNDFLAYRRYHYHDGRKRAFREELTKEMQEKLLLAKRQVDTEYERIRASNTDLRGKQAQRNKHLRAKASIARAYFDTKGIPLTYGEGETYNNALKAFLKKKSENPEALTRRAQGRPDEKWKAKMEAYIANPDGYQTTDDESKRSNPRTLPNPSKRPRRKRR
jgi:hypothetical protein